MKLTFKLFSCKICEEIVQDPLQLPCTEILCNDCIDSLSDKERKIFECPKCNASHPIPDNGFPVSDIFKDLLQIESEDKDQNFLVNDLKCATLSIQGITEKIESDLANGETLIRDHCNKVRNNTKLAIEEAHIKLDQTHKEFVDEIDKYEHECHVELKKMQQNKAEFEDILKEAKLCYDKSKNLFNNIDKNQLELKSRLVKAEQFLDKLEVVYDKLHSDMFKGSFLKFEKNSNGIDSQCLGLIKRQSIDLNYLKNIENINEINLKEDLKNEFKDFKHGLPHRRNMSVTCFKEKFFLYTYLNKKNNLNFSVLDSNLEIRAKKRSILPNINLRYFNTCSSRNSIYVYVREVHSNEENLIVETIRSFDENLNFVAMLRLDVFMCMTSFNDVLFVGFIENDLYRIRSYDSKLKVIQDFGQMFPNLPFHFPKDTSTFLVNEQFFIMCETLDDEEHVEDNVVQNRISLINRTSGLVEKSFLVHDFNEFIIYLNKYVLTYEHVEQSVLRCYNFSGDLVEKTILDDDKLIADLEFSIKKELYFLNSFRGNLKIVNF
jgi:hypothetical protein